jgi:hypothetical protein
MKTVIVFLLFIATVVYLITNSSLNLVNVKLYQSLVFFRNDMNPGSNILEYIALHIIKLIFNIDIHNLRSFFDNINPLFK